VQGFGGMRVKEDQLVFQPMLPQQWKRFQFRVNHRGVIKEVTVHQDGVNVSDIAAV
jgi:maltose phosphorylase